MLNATVLAEPVGLVYGVYYCECSSARLIVLFHIDCFRAMSSSLHIAL